MDILNDALESAFGDFRPMFSLVISMLGILACFRFIFNVLRGDYGGSSYSSASDVDEPVDIPFNDFEPDEAPEEPEEDESIRWTCDYCGSVHRNTDSVCDACGGRRLRW